MNRMRGSAHGRIDEKGRLKVPAVFRQYVEERYGRELFITSRDGRLISVYPLAVWEDLEEKLQGIPSTDPDRELHDFWTNFFGGVAELDKQGRATIPQVLREEFDHVGEVVVMGMGEHLVIANKDQMKERLREAPLTREVMASLSDKGV